MKFRFPIVIIDEDFRSENTSGLGIRALAQRHREGGHGGPRRDELRRPVAVRAAAVARVGVHPVDRRRRIHAGAGDRPGGRQPAQLHPRDPLQERRDPDLPVRRDAHVAAPPQRHPARAARLHPHVRGHAGVRRAPHHPRGEVVPRLAGAAVLPRARRLRAGRLVLVALPGALGRRRVPQEPGRPDVPPVLRREHAARRRVQRRGRARASSSTTRDPSPPPSAMPRASSTRTTASSSPTARRRRTRWCGMRTSRPATSSSWTATATCRCCTRSR